MKKVLLALAFGALLSTAQAAYTESNVTIQIKLLEQQPKAEKNGIETQVYKTFTLKTADVIRILKEEINDPARQWTKKARIIFLGDPSAIFQTGFYIREKGMEDYFLGGRLGSGGGQHVGNNRRPSVSKVKKTVATGNLTEVSRGFGTFIFAPNNDDEELEIFGLRLTTLRLATAKDRGDTFSIYTVNVKGTGTFELQNYTTTTPFHGVAEGSFKILPPKILLHPEPSGS